MVHARHLKPAAVVAAIGLSLLAACHHPAPPAAAPAPQASNDDALARARADSIARADAARRDADARLARARADSIARADAARRAEAAAREQLLAPVHFDFDRAEIRSSDQTVLDQKVGILTANRDIRIRIDGHTDERGSDEYNLALGMRRSAAVRRYFVDHGIEEARIALTSNGEERPVCRESDESCWMQNRRAEFAIVAGGERITAAR
jgi:peptidoglycan-associated lipoprotein